jgi:1-acyl-sn-glycerol-3-phosphate acyltransferase
MNKSIDYIKDINSVCYCNNPLGYIKDKIIMLEPCEHIIHTKCYMNSDIHKCNICNTKVKQIFTTEILEKLKDNPKYYQKYVDILSIQDFSDKSVPSYNNKFMKSLPKIMNIISKVPFSYGIDGAHSVTTSFLSMLNCKLVVKGIENIKDTKKVIISNHVSPFDMLPYFYIFKCATLASSIVNQSPLGRKFSSLYPIVFVDRGHQSKTVQKMKNMIDKIGSLLLFPEGMCTNPNTVTKFRSGAFHIGYPVCPSIITYTPLIYDSDNFELIKKMFSHNEITITINILPMEYPPFTPEKIENIRNKMAIAGNMALSRVTNRDIKD